MGLLLKISGLAVIMSASYIFGQLKVTALKNRKKNLRFLLLGLEGLKESVGFAGCELPFLYKKHFNSCKFLNFEGSAVTITEKDFSVEDIGIINEFFEGAGALDCIRECERTELFINLLKKQLEDAEERLSNEGKLWKTISLCMGFGAGVLLL